MSPLLSRLGLTVLAVAAAWSAGAPADALAADAADAFPTRSIKIVVGFPPGGGTDIVARLLAPKLAASLGQPVIVENKPGATGPIAAAVVARAEPDGYTLLLGANSTNAIAPATLRQVGFDPIKDFAGISMLASVPHLVAVGATSPVKTLGELVARSKADAQGLAYGTPGNGSAPNIVGELFRQVSGARLTHVPYKGAGPALNDLIAGHVDVSFDTSASLNAHVRAGTVRALAVAAPARLPQFPDVPTAAEAGVKGFEVSTWMGLLAPSRTPRPVVNKLSIAVRAALNEPDVREALTQNVGSTGVVITAPDAFDGFVKSDVRRYAELVERLGIARE